MARPPRSRAKRLGQRIGIALFAVFVSVPTLVWTYQIMLAIFHPTAGPTPASCESGMLDLLRSLDRARSAARLEDLGERQSLLRFRAALKPAWDSRPALTALCAKTEKDTQRLQAIDALRYAEEHAVRYEATALAGQRQRARELEHELESR